MRARVGSPRGLGARSGRRAAHALPVVAASTVALLAVSLAVPASAHAADLFPVDDWLGSGLKHAGDVVLGPLTFGAKEIARLLVTIVAALADLLVPKSLVRAGVDGIAWLVQLPPLGQEFTTSGGAGEAVRMPHLAELRGALAWVGITLLPLGLVIAGGRAVLAPSVDRESPSEVFGRVIVAGAGLLAYDWVWGAATELSHLITSGLLGLPWVTDGVERMLETLVIGGAAGSAVAAEFVVPVLVLVAGTALLALLLVRVGLEVASGLLYVLGGLVLGLSVTGFGWRLLQGWLLAVTAVFVLPVLWAIVFCTGAALMLDAGTATAHGGFLAFVAQLYNVAAALAVFWVAIKLAQGVFRHASGALAALAGPRGALAGGATMRAGGGSGASRASALAASATPAGLARFSQNLRGGLRAGAAAGVRAGSYPVRHSVGAAQAAAYPLRRPVQATREAAGALRHALTRTGVNVAALGDTARAHATRGVEAERHGGRYSARSATARDASRVDATSGRERELDAAARAASSAAVAGRPAPAAAGHRPPRRTPAPDWASGSARSVAPPAPPSPPASPPPASLALAIVPPAPAAPAPAPRTPPRPPRPVAPPPAAPPVPRPARRAGQARTDAR